MSLTISPEVEHVLGKPNADAFRAGQGLPAEFECYACGGIGHAHTDATVASVLATGTDTQIVVLAHAACSPSAVLSKERFDAITAKRTRSDGAQVASESTVVQDGKVHGRPESQPMPPHPVVGCPAGGLHPVRDGLATGEGLADRLVAATLARCSPCQQAAIAQIESVQSLPALIALVVNWAANCSQVTGRAHGQTGQAALERWRSTLAGEVPRPVLEAAKRVDYLAGARDYAHLDAGRLDPYLRSLTRRQRRAIAESCLDGLMGLVSLLGL
ncbi:hypothetical protein [Streptacidiphilus sp. EB103A]|uniref:hypothetical protein n=1 Tax=Streptacidiphilus sp. EB103A TaxID=3156275 RepID=UPI003514D99A